MKLFKKFVPILLLIITIANLGLVIFENQSKYFSFDFSKRYQGYKDVYGQSQYVNKKPTAIIPDETINTYAAAEYIKGTPPIIIAPDTPPFGRYLIGASILIFNNENLVILLSALASLYLLFLLGKQIFRSNTLALISPMLFSFEPLFKNQLVYTPLLDVIQLMFLLGSIYFFNKGFVAKKTELLFFIISTIFLGLFISTKFFITGITIVLAFLTVLFLYNERRKIIKYIATLPLAVLILLLNYIAVLPMNYDLLSFLGIQKWIFLYHQTQLIFPLSIWPLIYLNKWYVWWGDTQVSSDPQWLITWPIITTVFLIGIVLLALKKIERKREVIPVFAWALYYLAFFSIGQITSRYLIILIPVFYLISVYVLNSFVKILKR